MRIALIPSEPIRGKMAGIGIRYLELARRLPRPGIEIVLVNPGDAEVDVELPGVETRRFVRGELPRILADCDGAIAQGQLANDVLLEVPGLPVAVDLYDPFLVENLSYYDTLGLDPYRNDHATWVLQLARGDFFLCSCEEQRQYYLGLLTALGRVHPRGVAQDPDLQRLLAVVPFGVPDNLPAHRPLLGPRPGGARRLLFGGLYDWYDPWPVLRALERLDQPLWHLLFIRNPNPDGTPQRLLGEVESWCRERGWWQERVQVLDWVPAERRFDLLRDVDLLVATHQMSLETRLSLRTRFLEAMAAGCPVITSDGGAMSRLLRQESAGWVVPLENPEEPLASALSEALAGGEALEKRRRGAERLLATFEWDRVLVPLVAFCAEPRRDDSKEEFAFRPPTLTPPDHLGFRLRRWLRRLAG